MDGGSVSRRWRTVALVAIGIAIGTTLTAPPVYSHVGGTVTHLWMHIKPKTDARYYTKAQADGRYARKGAPGGGNADLLDGLDSTDFLRSTGKAADADLLDGLDSAAFLRTTGKSADANLLDGQDSTAFLPAGGKAANADLLDGLNWTSLQQVCRTGSVHAIVMLRGAADYSSTFIDVPESFTCWRGSGKVAARRLSTGRYEVILSGAPFNSFCLTTPMVIGSIMNDTAENNFFNYSSVPCGGPLETRIIVTNISSGGTLQDGSMSFAWYRILTPSAPG
jgi:hypothetical protein